MKHLLVVEDNKDYQELLENYLSNAGYNVTAADNGLDAVDILEDKEFDLIILDVMLPKIDGFTLCELIRKKSDVPVVMLTARSAEEDQMRGYELKVDEYISKTVSMPVIVSKIGASFAGAALRRRKSASRLTECARSGDPYGADRRRFGGIYLKRV